MAYIADRLERLEARVAILERLLAATPMPAATKTPRKPREAQAAAGGSFPAQWPEREDLLRWINVTLREPAYRDPSVREAALVWAIERLRDWHEAGGTPNARKNRTERGWTATLRNGIRSGWLLEGFSPDAARQKKLAEWKSDQALESEALALPYDSAEDTAEERERWQKMGL